MRNSVDVGEAEEVWINHPVRVARSRALVFVRRRYWLAELVIVPRDTPLLVGASRQDVSVAKMDSEWAITEIDAFMHATDQVACRNTPGSGVLMLGGHMRGSQTEASQRAHVVEQILDRVLPGWAKDRPQKDGKYSWLRDQASRAKAALQRQGELDYADYLLDAA